MHPKWLTPQFSILLSVLSLVIGYVGIFALSKWWAVVLAVPPVVVFFLSFHRLQNVPCRPNCLLNLKDARGIYATAVIPEQAPVCAKLTIEHNVGMAVAAMVARAMLTSVVYLKRMLLALEEEIQGEAMFSLEALDTHTSRIQRIQAIATGVVCGGNLTGQCYLLIPNTDSIHKELDSISKSLMDLLKKIANFRDAVPVDVPINVEVPAWKDKIRSLLILKTCPIVTKHVRELDELTDRATEVLDSLRRDWHDDIRFLWEDSICKPSVAEDPPEPRIKVEDIVIS